MGLLDGSVEPMSACGEERRPLRRAGETEAERAGCDQPRLLLLLLEREEGRRAGAPDGRDWEGQASDEELLLRS